MGLYRKSFFYELGKYFHYEKLFKSNLHITDNVFLLLYRDKSD